MTTKSPRTNLEKQDNLLEKIQYIEDMLCGGDEYMDGDFNESVLRRLDNIRCFLKSSSPKKSPGYISTTDRINIARNRLALLMNLFEGTAIKADLDAYEENGEDEDEEDVFSS
jgi:hypothetical protein